MWSDLFVCFPRVASGLKGMAPEAISDGFKLLPFRCCEATDGGWKDGRMATDGGWNLMLHTACQVLYISLVFVAVLCLCFYLFSSINVEHT